MLVLASVEGNVGRRSQEVETEKNSESLNDTKVVWIRKPLPSSWFPLPGFLSHLLLAILLSSELLEVRNAFFSYIWLGILSKRMHFLNYTLGQMICQRLSVTHTDLRSSLNSEIMAFLGQFVKKTRQNTWNWECCRKPEVCRDQTHTV